MCFFASNIFACDFKCHIRMRHYFKRHFEIIFMLSFWDSWPCLLREDCRWSSFGTLLGVYWGFVGGFVLGVYWRKCLLEGVLSEYWVSCILIFVILSHACWILKIWKNSLSLKILINNEWEGHGVILEGTADKLRFEMKRTKYV